MIVIMKSEATKAQIKSVIERVKKEGLEVHLSEGKEQTIIGLVGDTTKCRMWHSIVTMVLKMQLEYL